MREARSGLAAIALAAALAMGAPGAFAQQAQQPAPAPPQQPMPQQQGQPQGETAPGEGTITERQFQDWTVRCGRQSEQAPQMCEMQHQTIDNEGRTVMAVAVGELPGTSDLGLLILLPLRVLLPAGVSLQVDSGAGTPLQVDWCERQGCRIEMLLEPDLLNRLKAGTKATVLFEALDEERQVRRLAYPISLLGFTAALNEVTS